MSALSAESGVLGETCCRGLFLVMAMIFRLVFRISLVRKTGNSAYRGCGRKSRENGSKMARRAFCVSG